MLESVGLQLVKFTMYCIVDLRVISRQSLTSE